MTGEVDVLNMQIFSLEEEAKDLKTEILELEKEDTAWAKFCNGLEEENKLLKERFSMFDSPNVEYAYTTGGSEVDRLKTIIRDMDKKWLATAKERNAANLEIKKLQATFVNLLKEVDMAKRELEKRGEAIVNAMWPHRGMVELIPAVKELADNYSTALKIIEQLKKELNEKVK